jgi:Sortilin, neurotensin receptor 3,
VSAYCFPSVKTYVTQDAFQTSPRKLLNNTSRCIWAYSTPQFKAPVSDSLVYCIAFDPSSDASSSPHLGGFFEGMRSLRDSRLYSSTDFFENERNYVDLGIGKDARGLVGIGGVQKYIVTALKPGSFFTDPNQPDVSHGDEMILYVTEDGQTWSRALFPHGHGLRQNAYTIVESTSHSILVDVLTDTDSASGTLFTSNSNGTYFVRSLEHTNRNSLGIVDFEKLENVEGVALANVVSNWEDVEGSRGAEKRLKTKITFDDGKFTERIVGGSLVRN